MMEAAGHGRLDDLAFVQDAPPVVAPGRPSPGRGGCGPRGCPSPKLHPVGQVVDLSALIRTKSELDDHPPAPPASTPPVPLRRPPPARPGEPRLAPAARRVQDERRLGPDCARWIASCGSGLARVWAGWRQALVIVIARHRPAVAAAPLPRALDQALRPPSGGPPADQRGDHRPHQNDGRDESPVGRPENPWRTHEARHRRGRAHRLPADAEAARTARRRPGARSSPTTSGTWSPSISSRCPPRACGCSSSSSCSPTIAGASSTST